MVVLFVFSMDLTFCLYTCYKCCLKLINILEWMCQEDLEKSFDVPIAKSGKMQDLFAGKRSVTYFVTLMFLGVKLNDFWERMSEWIYCILFVFLDISILGQVWHVVVYFLFEQLSVIQTNTSLFKFFVAGLGNL